MVMLFHPGPRRPLPSFGLLLLRLAAGGMMAARHGWTKVADFDRLQPAFPDPLGMGSFLALASAAAAELGCGALVVLGLATRIAVLPLAFTMSVAAFVVQRDAPFADRELALLYLGAYLALLFNGAGIFSLDAKLARPDEWR